MQRIPHTHSSARTLAVALALLVTLMLSACGSTSSHPGAQATTTATKPSSSGQLIYVIPAGIGPSATATPLYAIEAGSGIQAWSVNVGGIVSAPPVLVGSVLIVATLDISHATPQPTSTTAHLYGLDASTGHHLWHKDQSSNNPQYMSLDAAGNLAVAEIGEGVSTNPQFSLIAVNPADGSQVWQVPLPGYANNNAITSGQGMIFVGASVGATVGSSANSKLFAFDSGTGKVIWQQSSNLSVGNLIAVGGTLYGALQQASSGTGSPPNEQIRAMDATSGRQIWAKTFNLSGSSIITANSSSVFVGGFVENGGSIAALKASDGSQIWQDPFVIDTNNLAVTDTTIYGSFTSQGTKSSTSTKTDSIAALDASTGSTIWSVPVSQDEGTQSITLGDGELFVVSMGPSGAQLEALKTSDGSTIWNYPLTGSGALPPVVG